jgi:hypothetical protein
MPQMRQLFRHGGNVAGNVARRVNQGIRIRGF